MIRLILLAITAFGTLFFSSRCFVDSWIVPKWIFFAFGISLFGMFTAINYVIPFDKPTKSFRPIFEISIVLALFVQALYGIMQYMDILPATTQFSVNGSFDNPAGFAACLSVGFPFILYRCNKSSGNFQYAFIFISVIVIIAIVLSGSRAGIIAVLVVLAFWSKGTICSNAKVKWLVLMVAFVVGTVCLYYVKKDSADGRLLIWKCSLSMIKDKWLTGHGASGFQAHYMDYQADYFENHPDSPYAQLADNVQSPFNEYIHLMVNYGMVGLLLFVLCISYLLYCYFKFPFDENKIAIYCWLSVGAFGFFSYPLLYPFVWIILLYCTYLLTKENLINLLSRSSSRKKQIIALIVLCLSVYTGFQTYHRLQAERDWKKAISCKPEYAICYYPQLAKVLINDRYFLYNYAVVLFENSCFEESFVVAQQCRKHWINYELEILLGDICKNLQKYQQAERYYLRASLMCPCRFHPLNFLYDLYLETGNEEKALEIAEKVIMKPVKVKSLVVSQIKYKMKQALMKYRSRI